MNQERSRAHGVAVVLAATMLVAATISAVGTAAAAPTSAGERVADTGDRSLGSPVTVASTQLTARQADRPVGVTQSGFQSSNDAGASLWPETCPTASLNDVERGTIEGPAKADLGENVRFDMSRGSLPKSIEYHPHDITFSPIGTTGPCLDARTLAVGGL